MIIYDDINDNLCYDINDNLCFYVFIHVIMFLFRTKYDISDNHPTKPKNLEEKLNVPENSQKPISFLQLVSEGVKIKFDLFYLVFEGFVTDFS